MTKDEQRPLGVKKGMKELKDQEKDLDQIIKAIERDIEYDF